MFVNKDISGIIATPKKCGIDNAAQLKEYTKKYPYSSLFSILYLKALSNSSNIHFEEELAQHSYRIPDREQLYNLIQQHSLPKENEYETIEDEIKIDDSVKNSRNTRENENVEKKHISQKEEEPNKSEEESTANEVSEIESNSSKKTADAIDETILQHAFSANYRLPELNEEEIVELNKKNNPTKKEEEIAPQKVKTEVTIDTKQSFKSWLNSNESYTHYEHNQKAPIQDVTEDSTPLKTKKELLDEVKKPKKAFFSPVQKAKESLNEDVLPVSETLAKIYALQGNFPKAISAYMQLSLINPEKKIFFALRIKELEQKLKHK